MSLVRIFAITRRILAQFSHDHRSVALVFVAPIFVMSVLGYVFRAQRIRSLYENLGVRNITELKEAARKHQVREISGFGPATEEKILRQGKARD